MESVVYKLHLLQVYHQALSDIGYRHCLCYHSFCKESLWTEEIYETWIFIFTCSSSSAISLEVVSTCDTDCCINSMRRF